MQHLVKAFLQRDSRPVYPALEPYVSYYDIHTHSQSQYLLPFQMMGYCLFFFVGLGFYFAIFLDDPSLTMVVAWLFFIFAPFYLPGLYHYSQYLARDQHTSVEVDCKNRWMRYQNSQKGENLLFHADQVLQCRVYLSVLFPYQIDYLSLSLEGGKKIHLSGLIVEPKEIIEDLSLPFEVERKLFNSVPKD